MNELNGRARNRLMVVLFVGVLMGALDIAIVGPALPAIQGYFGVDDRSLAWIYSTYVLFNLIGTPLMARLSDIYGRRVIYVLDVVLFGLGSLLVALAPSFVIVLVGRSVQGLGSGGIFPVASAVIGDTFPAEKRGSALGLIGAVFGIAFILGPILGGILLVFGWQWLFLINLPIALVVIGAGLRLLPTSRRPGPVSIDWAGMVTLVTLLAALAVGINRIDTSYALASLASMGVGPFLLLAVLLLLVFVRLERRAADPMLRIGLYESRQMLLVAGLAVGGGLAQACVAFIPQLAVSAYGVRTSSASFMLLPLMVAVSVGSPVSGRLLDRVGSRVVVLAGCLLLVAGLLGLGLAAPQHPAFFYASTVLLGLSIAGLVGAPLRYITLGEARPAERATAQGSVNLFLGVGQLVGGAMVGAVAGSRGGGVVGYATAFTIAGVFAFLMVGMAMGLRRRRDEIATMRRATPAG